MFVIFNCFIVLDVTQDDTSADEGDAAEVSSSAVSIDSEDGEFLYDRCKAQELISKVVFALWIYVNSKL